MRIETPTEPQLEGVKTKEGSVAMIVGGLAGTAIFGGSLLAGQIANKTEEIGSYPATAISIGVCIYGLKRLFSRA